jgi:hypothetical protein
MVLQVQKVFVIPKFRKVSTKTKLSNVLKLKQNVRLDKIVCENLRENILQVLDLSFISDLQYYKIGYVLPLRIIYAHIYGCLPILFDAIYIVE